VSVGHSRRTTSVQSSSSPYGVNRPSGAVSISESGKSNTGRSTSHHRRCSVIMRSSAGRSTLWAAVGAVPRASTPTLLCSPEPGAWLVAKARAEARDAQPDVDSNPFAPSSDDGIELVKCSETFGCLAVMSGRSAAQRQVARILSHTSSKTSQRYSRTGAIHKHSAPLTKRPTQLTKLPRPADKSTPSGGHDRTCAPAAWHVTTMRSPSRWPTQTTGMLMSAPGSAGCVAVSGVGRAQKGRPCPCLSQSKSIQPTAP
jgi:hypothetical protein